VLSDVAGAIGGRERIMAVRTLVLEGEGENFNLGQNTAPDAELPMFRVAEYRKAIDFENGRWRQDQLRTPTFMTGNPNPQRQITALDGDIAYNVAASGDATRAAETVARDRRRELLYHPIGILRAAMGPDAVVTLAQRDSTSVVLRIEAGGESFLLAVDPATDLPVAVTARSAHPNLGDVMIETGFADYQDVDGLQLPMRMTTKLDRFTTADIRLSRAAVDADAGDLAAPESVRSAAPPAATVNVTVEEVAPGVWYLAGQSHHSVAIEFADHLMLVEAPQSEARTLAVIARARELRPDKPLRYVVNTHHHFDHSGGIRAAVAAGLTVITHAQNEAFYREVAERPHTINPDSLARAPQPLQLEPVTAKRVFQDAMRTVEIYPIEGSGHATTLLMVYLPAERLLIEADVYSPPAPGAVNPPPAVFAPNLAENVQRNGLRVARIVPIHGRVVPFAALQAAARAAAGGP
jgi:glyoxylase-like metal-dependent hydrolase (beta-lactamase superfamily II)